MLQELSRGPASVVKTLTDTFTGDQKEGGVIGTMADDGTRRQGIDIEGILSIDNHSLRIRPLIEAGWGRAGVAYGPYVRKNGLTLAVYLVNGHNTSQAERLVETLRERLYRWWIGSETYSPMERTLQFLKSGRILRMWPQLKWWFRIRQGAAPVPKLDENLAVGWFDCKVPENPLTGSNAFVMHATGAENGELWAAVGSAPMPSIRSIQNLQIYYVVVLRESGAAYYAAAVPGANGLAAYPHLRPLAIDTAQTASPLYAGIHQAALGQIGFRLDTRVYGVRVQELPELAAWYGTAHAADRLNGAGDLAGSLAEPAGTWQAVLGRFLRRDSGACGQEMENAAIVWPRVPSGLLHVIASGGSAGLVFRYADASNHWMLSASEAGCALRLREAGVWSEVATDETARLAADGEQPLQLLDDGDRMSFFLGSRLLFGQRFRDPRLGEAIGVGVAAGQGTCLRNFESHPREVELPDSLRMGEPWFRAGEQTVAADDFTGVAGDLAGRKTAIGGRTWTRLMGSGRMLVTGDGAVRIDASAARPNPGRTAYTIDWDHPQFLDVSAEITPAGTGPGQGEHGLCGFMIWQDADNYITINIWRNAAYGGASISCFFHLDGFEDLYDAIWANVGNRVFFGKPFELRMTFDGWQYMMFVDGEPVLFRKLKDVYKDYGRFTTTKVGLLANWEWGNDTGSKFRNFVVRR